MKCTTGELHTLDIGTHIHLYHEWNEGTEGIWGEATVTRRHPLTIVIQPYTPTSPSATGENDFTCIAVYKTAGEGDLTELYFADERNGIGWNYIGGGFSHDREIVNSLKEQVKTLEGCIADAYDALGHGQMNAQKS